MTGAAKRNESTRSSMPPWPGISVPESLAPAARLMIGFGEVAGLRGERGQRPEEQRMHRVLAEAAQHHRDDDRAGHDAADDALDRLGRRDVA